MATFIEASFADRDSLAILLRDFYVEEHLEFGGDAAAAMGELLSDPALGRVFLVRDGDVVAGYFVVTFSFSLERGGRTALLDELYILPAFRRRGLGKAALDFAVGFGREEGCKALLLEVAHANPAAQALYARMGFVTLARHYLALRL